MNEIQKRIAELQQQRKELQGEVSKVKSFSKKLETGEKILSFLPKMKELGMLDKIVGVFIK